MAIRGLFPDNDSRVQSVRCDILRNFRSAKYPQLVQQNREYEDYRWYQTHCFTGFRHGPEESGTTTNQDRVH